MGSLTHNVAGIKTCTFCFKLKINPKLKKFQIFTKPTPNIAGQKNYKAEPKIPESLLWTTCSSGLLCGASSYVVLLGG